MAAKIFARKPIQKTNLMIVASVDHVSEIPALAEPSHRFFRLFLAIRKEVETKIFSEFAEKMVLKGIVYFSVWGSNSSRYEDLFDEVCSMRDGLSNNSSKDELQKSQSGDVVMTTSHEGESIEEALSFFVNCAIPDTKFVEDCTLSLYVCLNDQMLAEKVSKLLVSTNNSIVL